MPDDEIAKAQRERLFAALTRLVAEQGYEATSLDQVLESAEVPRSAFEARFCGKQDLFLALFDEAGGTLLRRVCEACDATPGDWEAKVRAGLAALVAHIDANRELARVCMVEARNAGPVLASRYGAWLRRFAALLRSGRDALVPELEDPEALERMVAGGIGWMIDEHLSHGSRERVEELLPAVIELALMPYGADLRAGSA